MSHRQVSIVFATEVLYAPRTHLDLVPNLIPSVSDAPEQSQPIPKNSV